MAFHMPSVPNLPVLRASFPEAMSRKPSTKLEEVQLQVALRFGGGRVALQAARHVVNTQAGVPAAPDATNVRQSIVSEVSDQPGNAIAVPHRSTSPGARRAESPTYEKMFRFEGHFETPNNPNPLEQTPEPAQPAQHAVRAVPIEHSKERQGLQAADAEPVTVQSVAQSNATLVDAQPDDLLIAAGVHTAQQEFTKSYAARRQRCESEFRRSHSPEWYDARFKQYVLRSHKENVPDYRYSQAMAQGPQSPLRQSLFSFSKLHPALADKHYLRTSDENERIKDAQWRLQQQQQQQHQHQQHSPQLRPATADAGRTASPSNTSWAALRQDADELQQHSQQVTNRAKEVIAASEAASGRLRTGSGVRARPRSAPFLKGSSRLSPADQQHISSLEAQIANLQNAVEELSHPHQGTAPSAQLEGHEQSDAEGIVADILTIAHSPVFDNLHSSQARRSLADHLVEEAEDQDLLPLSEEEQSRIASAAFDEHRWEEWDAATSRAMHRRALAGQARCGSPEAGFDSDLEEEDCDGQVHGQQQTSAHNASANQVGWRAEDEWMNEYRDNVSRDSHEQDAASARPGMAPEEEALIQQAYIPVLYEDLRSDPGPIGRLPKPRAARRGRAQRPFTPTSPRPMAFELRAQSRPKTIMQVKMEQDQALRHAEEEAVRHYHFKANSLPKSTTEPRYENIKRQQADKLRDSHERNLQLLKSQERPFSFYGKALAKEELAKKYRPPSAKDFQQPFKANPIPKSSLEERLSEINAERAAKKLAAHQAAEQRLKEAAMPPRMQLAAQRSLTAEGKLGKGRHAEKCGKRFDPPARGGGRHSPVPDFKQLHTVWESKLADCKASNRSKSTKPEDPHLGGKTIQEAEARKVHAEERRQQALQQASAYREHRIETRWPYMSPSTKVKPTPPPVFSPLLSTSPPTRAHQLRSAAIRAAMHHAEARRDSHNESSSIHASHAQQKSAHAQHANSQDAAQAADLQTGDAARQIGDLSAAGQSPSVSSAACNEPGSDLMASALQAEAHAFGENQQEDSHEWSSQQDSLQNSYSQMQVDAAEVVGLVAIHVRSELTESHFDI